MYNLNLGNFTEMFTVVEDSTIHTDPENISRIARNLTKGVAETVAGIRARNLIMNKMMETPNRIVGA